MTKRQKKYAMLYMCENCPRDFSMCYRNPSTKKLKTVANIREKMIEEGGFDLRFLTFSIHYFTCAYMVEPDLLHVFTPTSNFYIHRTDF